MKNWNKNKKYVHSYTFNSLVSLWFTYTSFKDRMTPLWIFPSNLYLYSCFCHLISASYLSWFFFLCFSCVILSFFVLFSIGLNEFLLGGPSVLFYLSSGLEVMYAISIWQVQPWYFNLLSKVAESGMMPWVNTCSQTALL